MEETEEEKAARQAAEAEAQKAQEQAEAARVAALREEEADKEKADAMAVAAAKEAVCKQLSSISAGVLKLA